MMNETDRGTKRARAREFLIFGFWACSGRTVLKWIQQGAQRTDWTRLLIFFELSSAVGEWKKARQNRQNARWHFRFVHLAFDRFAWSLHPHHSSIYTAVDH
jgi:hypothetical protein